MKTIKQLSEELSISKVGLTKKLERHNLKSRLIEENNRYLIDEDLEQDIRRLFEHRAEKTTQADNKTSSSGETITSEIIAVLKAELESKNKLIEELSTQNSELIKAIRETNQLHHDTQALLSVTNEEGETPTQEENKGPFARLFR